MVPGYVVAAVDDFAKQARQIPQERHQLHGGSTGAARACGRESAAHGHADRRLLGGRGVSERILFYPWLRQGWSGAALPPDAPGAALAARVTLTMQLRVNNAGGRKHVSLLGPGDVVGIDRRQVIRTDPAPAARAFEPNFLACVDFDRPDFPWLFTPASANAQNRLRPWVCLIVVRRQHGVTLTVNASRPLPVLTIEHPARAARRAAEFGQRWAWAHAQVAPFEGALEAALQVASGAIAFASDLSEPSRAERRLLRLCRSRVRGRTTRRPWTAGDGRRSTLAPAWAAESRCTSILELPVYYSWEFATGRRRRLRVAGGAAAAASARRDDRYR